MTLWLLIHLADPIACSQALWWLVGCVEHVWYLSRCEQLMMAMCGWNPYY